MRLQNINPIDSGVNTYGRLQNIGLQKQAGERAQENHETNQKVNQSRLEQIDQQKTDATARRKQEAVTALIGRQLLAEENGLEADFTDEELESLASDPMFNLKFLQSDEVGQAVEIGDRVLAKEISMMSPEAAQAVSILSPDLQKGSPGKKAINQIVPGRQPGTLAFDLSVDGVSGKPLTENRSADDDDPVKEIPVENLMKRQMGIKNMRKLLESEEGRNYFKAVYRQRSGQGKPKDAVTYGKMIQDPVSGLYGQKDSNGKFHVMDARKGKATGSSGNPPGDLQVASWLMSENPNLSRTEALKLAKQASHNPQKYIESFVQNTMKAQNDQFYQGEKLSNEEIHELAVASHRYIQDSLTNNGGNQNPGSPSPAGSKTPNQQHIQALLDAPDEKRNEIEQEFIAKFGALPEEYENKGSNTNENSVSEGSITDPEPKAQQLDPRVNQIDYQVEKLEQELGSIEDPKPRKKPKGIAEAMKHDKEYNSKEAYSKRKSIRNRKKVLEKKIKELNDIKESLAFYDGDSSSDQREKFRNNRRRERLAQTAGKYGIDISSVQNIANN